MFLHADLDRELSRAGGGDNGGIATMLVRLGDRWPNEPGIDRVLTLSRGSVEAAVAALDEPVDAHVLVGRVPLLAEPTDAANAWPLAVAAERGIRRALTARGRVDVLHLRMADVGSLAAAGVAARLGIPTVFTLAPDPHAVIHSLDMTGALTRRTFGTVDEREHYWFRTDWSPGSPPARSTGCCSRGRTCGRSCGTCSVWTSRARSRGPSAGCPATPGRAALGGAGGHRHHRRRAGPATTSGAAATRRSTELTALVDALPEHRRGLPLLVSVGRLHRVKGMATVVEAWASDPRSPQRCNLLIVGGDLAEPSVDEREQLDRSPRWSPATRRPPGAAAARAPAQRRRRPVDGRRSARPARLRSPRAACTCAAA